MKTRKHRKPVREGDRTYRIVAHERGSWKWQDAYSIATYVARRDRNGNLRWYSEGYGSRAKYSMPQLHRMAFTDIVAGALKRKIGSIHRQLVRA